MEGCWVTAVTDVKPNKIIIRGYPLDKLMLKVSFTQAAFLIWTGELPTKEQNELFNLILVAGIDHGGSPPSTLAARTTTSTGAPLNAALATGILSINKHHGGAVEDCMRLLEQIAIYDGNMKDKATEIVRQFRSEKKKIPGLGHRLHTKDPRVAVMMERAEALGLAGKYVKALKLLREVLYRETGRDLPINVDGGMAALLWEIGIKPELANAVFMLARVPGLVAHIIEEKERQKPMRKIEPTGYIYDGKKERDLS